MFTLLFITWICASDSGVYINRFPSYTWSGNDYNGQLSNNDLTISGITLNKHTIDDVIKKLGYSKKFQLHQKAQGEYENPKEPYIGDPHDINAVCYLKNEGNNAYVIIFGTLSLEFGGNLISNITIGTKSIISDDNICSISDTITLATNSGISIGKSLDEINSILGKSPNYDHGDIIAYRYSTEIIFTEEEMKKRELVGGLYSRYYDRITGLELVLKDNIVSAFSIYILNTV